MIHKIAFTYYCVRNMDKAVHFYQNILGLKLLFQRDDWSEFEIDGQRLALRKTETNMHTGGAAISLHTDSIEAVIDKLKENGVSFAEDLQIFSYGKLASFLDPDGNILGLYQPPPKSNSGRP